MKIYQVYISNYRQTLTHANEMPLLEKLEKNGIIHEYQCRSGYCGSCRVKLQKGKVSYKEQPLAFLNPNEILLCCCQLEDDIEIEL
ncbi:class I ribonucleotide reductase maintenance protein YfaE [Histophilus somni]|uniref:2Fe-2S ferredoxin-like protein n=2 Tax=Histophilus somni TaxID=731 RepID=A0AAX2S553_HISSO|nr:class I ribonucleotide reductase maintenance protein YfaE [Histophilus somni]ACA31182.1 ferredoxin [Histophilus somni 2336]MBB5150628.1 ferredoxin [Histophilus somni]QEH08919.1 2Fe-2S ferredoxin-like protein [Histophilus somni]QEH12499.1 2Fe-2S ferredoxin-like protein [Histophilus somni]QEH21602.1 2Fe-2S ferredoxin-like protein [Histophilus somni]